MQERANLGQQVDVMQVYIQMWNHEKKKLGSPLEIHLLKENNASSLV
jgi:hypothetical protein